MPLTQVDSGLLESGAALENIGTGNITPAYLNTQAQYTGFKNRIINGGMGIWQRGTSFPSLSSYTYTADRWNCGPFGIPSSYTRSTSVPAGFQYSMQVQRPSGGTNTNIVMALQVIESNNMYDLAGQPVTVSFWARAGSNFSASGSTLFAQVNTGTVADQGGSTYFSWTGVAANVSGSVTLTTSWQRFTVTGTFQSGALEAALLFYFTPTGTAGADDSFYITGVQLEKGSTATSFDYRDIGRELIMCQRYYHKLTSATNIYFKFAAGCGATAISAIAPIYYPVTMRSLPSFNSSAVSTFSSASSTLSAFTAIASESISTSSTCIAITTSSNSANTGRGFVLEASGTTSAFLEWSAEL